jgi:hypothetical protein
MRGDNCYDVSVEYGVTTSDIYNTKTLKTCAESSTWDIGDNLEICVRPEEPPPPPPTDNFSCSDGTELPPVIVTAGANCYDTTVKYDVTYDDIYNVNTGKYCAEIDTWNIGDTLRICKRDVEEPPPPPDNYVCNGVSLGEHTVVAGNSCYDLSVQYDVQYGDIFNTRNALTCSQDPALQTGDLLRICDTSAVAATISE